MQCPEGDKEIIDDLPLFVSPCILSTPVNIMQECDNKVVQKSASFIHIIKCNARVEKNRAHSSHGIKHTWSFLAFTFINETVFDLIATFIIKVFSQNIVKTVIFKLKFPLFPFVFISIHLILICWIHYLILKFCGLFK